MKTHSPNADTDQESKGRETGEKPHYTIMSAVRARGQGSEQDQDDGRSQQGPLAGIMIRDPTEEQLTDNGTGEGKGSHIGLGGGFRLGFAIYLAQHRVHLADDSAQRVNSDDPVCPQNLSITH